MSNDEHTVLLLQLSCMEQIRNMSASDVIRDQSGCGNHGVLNAPIRLVTLPENQNAVGLQLPGGAGVGGLTVTGSPSLDVQRELTIELWVKTDDLASGYVVLKKGNYGFLKYRSHHHMAYYVHVGGTYDRPLSFNGDTSLHYYALVCKSQISCLCFVDGHLFFNSTLPGRLQSISQSTPLYIGHSDGWNAVENYRGTIFSIRISNISRSAEEIAETFMRFGH